MELPIPTLNIRVKGNGAVAVVLLGISSGLASACCAPVFAGVVAITALGGSMLGSLLLAVAYLFGMVFPLMTIALVWESLSLERRWRRLLPTGRVAIFGRRVGWIELLSGTIFLLMGGLAISLALSGQQRSRRPGSPPGMCGRATRRPTLRRGSPPSPGGPNSASWRSPPVHSPGRRLL